MKATSAVLSDSNMAVMERAATRRQVLRLAGSELPGLLLPAKTAHSAGDILTRSIPRSGEALPVVGLGTAVNFDAGSDAVKQTQLAVVLQTLAAGGGKLVDTASSYGSAEDVLGALMTETSLRPRLFLATKLEAREVAEGVPALDGTLRRLRTDKLELLMLHNISRPDESLATLRSWQTAGTVRYIGISTILRPSRRSCGMKSRISSRSTTRSATEKPRTGCYLLPPTLALRCWPIYAFGRGRLFRAVRGRQLPDWAAEFDARSWAQFFLKYLIADPALTAIIPGTANPQHMQDNLDAGRGRLPDAAQRQRMVQFIQSTD